MSDVKKDFEKFLSTYSGQKLLKEHSLSEEGIWHIRGEDPNCDFGGPHHQPDLGYLEGKLQDVIYAAVQMSGFWQWGAGGRITKAKPRTVKKIEEYIKDNEEIKELLKQRDEIDKRIKEIGGK